MVKAYIKSAKIPVSVHAEWRLIIFACALGAGCLLIFTFSKLLFAHLSIMVGGIGLLLVATLIGAWKKWLSRTVVYFICAFLVGCLLVGNKLVAVSRLPTMAGYMNVLAVIEDIEHRANGGYRLNLQPIEINSKTEGLPARVRLSTRVIPEQPLKPGDTVSLGAVFEETRGKIIPGGYDVAAITRYQGIAAEGFVTKIKINKNYNNNNIIYSYFNVLRKKIETQILTSIDGQPGAVAVALLVGYRGNLTAETNDTLRRAGLSHLLAISGLHMGLVTATVFFVFELFFAAIPVVALRIMPAKLAVVPAWLTAVFYLGISGTSVSATRAFIMVSVGLFAVLLDRKVVSLRSVALAAIAILVAWPESILTIGFQMSFAATAGLVAFYEVWAKRDHSPARGPITRTLQYFTAIAVTCFIAQASVAPFSLFHFQSLSLVGLLTNMIVLPVVSLMLMPLLVLGLFGSAFGAFAMVGWPAEMLIAVILKVSTLLADHQWAVFHADPLSPWAFMVAVLAFLGLITLRGRWVSIILALGISAALWFGQYPAVKLLVSETGGIIAEKRGDMVFATGSRPGSFRHQVWNSYWGQNTLTAWEKLDRLCDSSACRYATSHKITRIKGLSGVKKACNAGDIVILPRRYKRYCKEAGLILTEEELADKGPAAIQISRTERPEKPQVLWSNP